MPTEPIVFSLCCIAAISVWWSVALTVTVWDLATGAQREWRALEARLEEREDLIDRLCRETKLFFVHDPVIGRLVAQLANPAPHMESDIRAMRRAIVAGDVARQVREQIGSYPTLFHSQRLMEVFDAIETLDRRIAGNIARYNTYAASFNIRRHDFAAAVVTRAWSPSDLPTLGAAV